MAIAATGLCLASPATASAAQPPAGTTLNWGSIYHYVDARDNSVIVPTPTPVGLPAGTHLTAISAAVYDSLALTSAGSVLAWGQNTYGQLGDGTTTDSYTPVPVDLPKGTKVTAVSAGGNDALAVTPSGGVLAWGWNQFGQLGDGTRADSSTPVAVDFPAGTRVTAVAAGSIALALTSDGRVFTWGDITGSTPVPVDLPAGVRVTAIASGAAGNYSLAVTSDGRVLAWGVNNYGELGDGTISPNYSYSSTPVWVDLPAGTRVTAIAAGNATSLAVTSDGRVLAWGENDYGELGDGSTTDSSTPVWVDLPAGTRVTSVAAGYRHGLALTSDGGVLAWGINSGGELGDGTTGEPSDTPVWVDLPADTRVTAIAAGSFSSLALAAPDQHKPPVLANIESSALRYAAGAAPVRVTPSLTAASTATASLAGATVTVSSGLVAGQDVLAFTGQRGITGSYSASTGVLAFTGTATVSAYVTELRSVTYRDTNAATPYGSRTISFQVSDGEPDNSLSNVESRTVLVTAKPPVAVSDKATTGSGAPVTINVLANDTDPAGLPLTIASVNTTGTKGTVTINPGQTITYNPNGQFAGLAQGQTATDKFTYKATDGTQTSNSATVTVTITGTGTAPQPPIVTAHSYNAVGNTPLGVGTHPAAPATTVTGSVLTSDSDADPSATLSVTANTTPAHGTVTMNPNGTFTYLPDPGYTGTDSFQATVASSNAHSPTATETVTITVGTVVWYVNNSLAAAGNGQAASPFNTLAAATAAAGASSVVFLYQGNAAYAGGVSMQPGEDLWGQPHGLTVGGHALVPAGGSTPAITDGSGDGIDLAEGADVEGVNVTGPSGDGIAAVSVNDATVGATTPVAVSGAGVDGIFIDGGDGKLNFGDTSVNYGSLGGGVVVERSGGAVTFGGPINAQIVSLTNNAGATIAFTGTLTLIGKQDGDGLTATGGGTVTATGPGSTLSGVAALTVQNTTIGAAGLTFQSISSTGSNSDGIDLVDTGSGGLTVTGTGTPGSGGTIQNSQDAGIELFSTGAPSLTDMAIQGNLGGGIGGSEVNGLTLADSTVSGNSGGGLGIGGGDTNVTASVTGSTFTGNHGPGFQFGSLAWARMGTDSLTFSNNTVGGNLDAGVLIDPGQFSTITVDDNNIQANPSSTSNMENTGGDAIEIIAAGETLTGTVRGNTIGAPAAPGSGGDGIGVSAANGSTDLTITGNHIYQYSDGAGINFSNSAGLDLTITGNTIADPSANSNWGIRGQDGAQTSDGGTVCAAITGNSIAGSGPAGHKGGADVELDQDGIGTFDLPGYTGGPLNVSAVESFLAANNDGDGTPTAVATVSASGGVFAGVTSC